MTSSSENKGGSAPYTKFQQELLDADGAGQRLILIEKEIGERPEEHEVAAQLTQLHNEEHIDLTALFRSLQNIGPGFFEVRRIFELALPELQADTAEVMRCVQHLVDQAGEDMAAGHTIKAFVSFIERKAARTKEALTAAKKQADLIGLLPAVLISGSQMDPDEYEQETLQLIEADDHQRRRQALFALGQLERNKGEISEGIYAALERTLAGEKDDETLRTIAKTAAALLREDNSHSERLLRILDTAIAKGEEAAIHGAVEIFADINDESPEQLLETIEPHLRKIAAENGGTIRLLDHGLHQMVRRGHGPEVVVMIQGIALEPHNEIKISALESTLRALHGDPDLRSKAMTAWLLSGNANLCRAAEHVVGLGHAANPHVEVDAAAIDVSSPEEVLYLARKIIGYLFTTPESAVEALISLLRQVDDESLGTHIGQLLLDPMLINYPGKARTRVEALSGTETGLTKIVIDTVLEKLEEYLDGLRSIDALPELQLSEAQRESFRRYQTRQMANSMKEARQRSVLASIFKTQTVLYGRSSINYVYDGEGNAHRQEIPMRSHSVEMELPRSVQLDPIGIENTLLLFRAEKRPQ